MGGKPFPFYRLFISQLHPTIHFLLFIQTLIFKGSGLVISKSSWFFFHWILVKICKFQSSIYKGLINCSSLDQSYSKGQSSLVYRWNPFLIRFQSSSFIDRILFKVRFQASPFIDWILFLVRFKASPFIDRILFIVRFQYSPFIDRLLFIVRFRASPFRDRILFIVRFQASPFIDRILCLVRF